MKTTHKQKIKIARRLIGNKKLNLFNNKMWNQRAIAIATRVRNKLAKTQARIAAKKENGTKI